jgi:hypothetical protein
MSRSKVSFSTSECKGKLIWHNMRKEDKRIAQKTISRICTHVHDKSAVVPDVTSCSMTDGHWSFWGTWASRVTAAAGFSETFVNIYLTTQHDTLPPVFKVTSVSISSLTHFHPSYVSSIPTFTTSLYPCLSLPSGLLLFGLPITIPSGSRFKRIWHEYTELI